MSININSKLDSDKKIWNIDLEGELDVSTADKLKEHLNSLLEREVVDMKMNLEN